MAIIIIIIVVVVVINRMELVCYLWFAFSAVTLLVGRQDEHPTCKNWVMRCWCGYLSGPRCKLFAYGPADADAIPKPHHLLLIQIQTGFTFLVPAYPGCPGEEAIKWV